MKDHRFAKYLENHISFQDLRAFVFQRKEDMEIFMSEVSEQQLMIVSVVPFGFLRAQYQQSTVVPYL